MKSFFIRQRVKKVIKASKVRSNVPFENARSVGVVFDSEEDFKSSSDWMGRLIDAGKNVEYIVHLKKQPENYNHSSFTDKDVNWMGKVNDGELSQFLSRNYDFLFYFGKNFSPIKELIMVDNKASCRVGFYEEGKEHCFDFMMPEVTSKSRAQNCMTIVDRVQSIKVK